MKSTTYFAEITTQKTEKYLFERGILGSTCLLACSSHVIKGILRVSLLKTVLTFLTNPTVQLISRGIGRSYFSRNLLSFRLWYDFKIQVKSRGRGTFLQFLIFNP